MRKTGIPGTGLPVKEGRDWQPQQCARIGAAPLRFQGRLLDLQEVDGATSRLFIGLFMRKSGGFTVATCRLTDCGTWADHAFVVDGFEAAVVAVEAYCADLQDELALAVPEMTGPADVVSRDIARFGRIAAEVVQFRALVGRALDHWMQVFGSTWDPLEKAG